MLVCADKLSLYGLVDQQHGMRLAKGRTLQEDVWSVVHWHVRHQFKALQNPCVQGWARTLVENCPVQCVTWVHQPAVGCVIAVRQAA